MKILCLWSALLFQESRPVAPTAAEVALQKAIQTEDGERDAARAEALYRQIMGQQDLPAEVRLRARLRLGQLLLRAGRGEAAHTELTAVAAGQGPTAAAAKALLEQRPGGDDESLRARVDGLLRRIQGATGDERKHWLEELHWLGEKAVPHIATAALVSGNDLEFVTVLSQAMADIGGPRVLEFYQRVLAVDDVDFKRATLRLRDVTPLRLNPRFDAIGRLLWRDADARVRLLGCLLTAQTLAELEGLASDPDDGVRLLALQRVDARLRSVRPEVVTSADLDLAARILARSLDDGNATVRQQAGWGLLTLAREFGAGDAVTAAHRSEAVRRALLALAQAKDARTRAPRTNLGKTTPFPAPLPAAELLAAARAIGPRDPSQLTEAANVLCFLISGSLHGWGRSELPAVLTLAGLGFDDFQELTPWVLARATQEDAPAVAAALGSLRRGDEVVQWLKAQHAEQQPGLVAPLTEWLRATLAKASNGMKDPEYSVIRLLALSGGADEFLVETARRLGLYSFVAAAYLDRPASPANDAVLLRLLDLPVVGAVEAGKNRTGSWNNDAAERNRVFLRLLLRGVPVPGTALVRAYDLGLVECQARQPDLQLTSEIRRGLGWFGARLPGEGPLLNRFPTEPLQVLVEACLATRSAELWVDMVYMLRDNAGNRLDVPPAILAVVARHCLETPESQRCLGNLLARKAEEVPGQAELFARALADADPKVQLSALQSMAGAVPASLIGRIQPALQSPDEHVALAAVRLIARTGAAEALPLLTPLHTHPRPWVRMAAAQELARLDPAHGFDHLGRLLRDSDEDNRVRACDVLEATCDRAALPLLLEALKDGSAKVRERAETAVRRVRFYLEQTTQLSAPPPRDDTRAAAQALLTQARTSKDRRIRIAALVSLGVLGVPEVLPGVVELLADPDAEVAAAADTAVKQLQARK